MRKVELAETLKPPKRSGCEEPEESQSLESSGELLSIKEPRVLMPKSWNLYLINGC